MDHKPILVKFGTRIKSCPPFYHVFKFKKILSAHGRDEIQGSSHSRGKESPFQY